MCTWFKNLCFKEGNWGEMNFEEDVNHNAMLQRNEPTVEIQPSARRLLVEKESSEGTVDQIADLIFDCKRDIVFLTGAGVSEASDIPTFRDPEHGVWAKHDPREVGTRVAFQNHPERLWRILMEMVGPENSPKPNPAHTALGELEKYGYASTVVTQNVDDLHEQSGNKNVIHLHGNLWSTECVVCGTPGDSTHQLLSDTPKEDLPPRCKRCPQEGVLKPDAILFGEMLNKNILASAVDAMEKTPLLFVLGTSARVSPATDLPVIASNAGARVVEINMEETQLTHTCVDYYIHAPLEIVLPQIVESVRRRHRDSKARPSIVAALNKTFSRPSIIPNP